VLLDFVDHVPVKEVTELWAQTEEARSKTARPVVRIVSGIFAYLLTRRLNSNLEVINLVGRSLATTAPMDGRSAARGEAVGCVCW